MVELLRIVHRYGMLVDGMMQDVETCVNLSVSDFHNVTQFYGSRGCHSSVTTLSHFGSLYSQCNMCRTSEHYNLVQKMTFIVVRTMDTFGGIWPKNTVGLIFHFFVMSLHNTLQSYIFGG